MYFFIDIYSNTRQFRKKTANLCKRASLIRNQTEVGVGEFYQHVVSVFCNTCKIHESLFFYTMNVAVCEILAVNKGKHNRTRQKCINVFIKVLIVMC